MCQETEYWVWSLFCHLRFWFIKLLFLFQVFPAHCRNIPGVVSEKKKWCQHCRGFLRVIFSSLRGTFHFGISWADSLLPPRCLLSRFSSSPRVAATDVKRTGQHFCFVLTLDVSQYICSTFVGKIGKMLPHMASGECLPCRMSLSSYPVNPRFCGHCRLLADCGLQEIGKFLFRHHRPSSIVKNTLKA